MEAATIFVAIDRQKGRKKMVLQVSTGSLDCYYQGKIQVTHMQKESARNLFPISEDGLWGDFDFTSENDLRKMCYVVNIITPNKVDKVLCDCDMYILEDGKTIKHYWPCV